MNDSNAIIERLRPVLIALQADPYPHVSNPPACKKRASVAVILRIRPAFEPTLTSERITHANSRNAIVPTSIDEFFGQEWVGRGDAEVLFIKRAGRAGDRWSGHIALPGGKRDPTDESDVAAAIRETWEEVGLDLSVPECLQVGNLPERIVATTFGRVPLMVLCPHIFLYTSKSVPALTPQPTEVASCHWVPLRALLSPTMRTREYVDTASRMAKQGGPILTMLLRFLIGKMMLSAVRLVPSESVYAASAPDFIPSTSTSHAANFIKDSIGIDISRPSLAQAQPLMLWGLTLGVLADFLDMLPPYNAVQLWRYPTFTRPDLRIFVWLFTYNLRRGNAHDLSAGTWPYQRRRRPSQTAMDATSYADAVTEAEPARVKRGTHAGIEGTGTAISSHDSVGRLLEGYYHRMNIAIGVFLLYRTTVGSAFLYYLYRMWRKRRARFS